ncbi:unnamed protein product [Laminaria digitata]
MVTSPGYLEIPLMTAERAWAYAMQRKQETVDAPYRVKRHVVTRLDKASKWAAQLEALCLETADERTCLEATSYSAWMAGNLLLEKEEWREALERYSTAHRICLELGKVGRIEDQDLFTRRVDEIEPILRYCRYNLDTTSGSAGDAAAAEEQLVLMGREGSSAGGDLLAAKLESVVAEARKKQASALDSVGWRGKKVAVRSEALRVALVKADDLARRLYQPREGTGGGGGGGGGGEGGGDPKPGQYLKVFGAYDDALAVVSEEAGRLQGKGGGLKMEANRTELEALRAYARHHKLRLMIERNERLVQELQDTRSSAGVGVGDGGERDPAAEVADIVHIYDALLQSVRGMMTNLGGGEDASDDIGEEEDELLENARADEARFRAFRCFFVIEAFSAVKKWAEASALFGHARSLCQDAADMLDDDKDPRAESLAKLDEMVQGAWHRTAAHALLLKAKQDAALSAGVGGISINVGGAGAGLPGPGAGHSLQERLKEFDAPGRGATSGKKRGYRIADLPPSLQTVPCKPRLLDLAFDDLEFPELDELAGVEKEPEVENPQGAAASAGGISGWVGWALGRSN